MKLLLENWRKYLKEEEEPVSPPDELSDEQKKHLRGILASIYGIVKGIETKDKTAEGALAEARPGTAASRERSRRRRAAERKSAIMDKVKQKLNLAHINTADLTQEQKDQMKQAYIDAVNAPDEAAVQVLHTIANGNPLNVGVIGNLFNNRAGKAILAVIGGNECADNFTLTCLVSAAASSGQGFFEE